VVSAVAVLLALPGGAQAAGSDPPCSPQSTGSCEVVVPLDRSGAMPGSIALHVDVLRATGPRVGTMFLVAGGPGQGSATTFDLGSADQTDVLRFLFPGYDLVAVDNRGTGQSGLITCPGLQNATTGTAEQFAALAADCANTIGPARRFYSTGDHVEDLDAVRQALGVQKIALYGVSYGTKLALAYALGHPGNVQRLVLDSVLPPGQPDPYETNVMRALPATLASYCAGGICRAATGNYAGDVVALANKLEAHPVSAKTPVPGGGLKTERMTGEDLISTVIQADLSPGLAAELPAAVHAARTGYYRPLFRLFDLTSRTSVSPASDLSFGLYAATTCADGNFPWSPSTPVTARGSIYDAAVAALPAGSFGPFGTWAARLGTAFFCELWPSPAGQAPLGPGPLPDVPVLAISGGFDMRTPTEDAAAVVKLFPQGHLLVVPGVGHSVLDADFSLCSQRAVRSWMQGGSVPSACPRVAPIVRPVAAFHARAVRRTRGTTLGVAEQTMNEGLATWFQTLFSSVAISPPGIDGGRLVPAQDGSGFRLVRYAIAPGIGLTGKLSLGGLGPKFTLTGTVKISGPAAVAGTLRVRANRITGTLGGTRVSGRL
jgi:pimeloyl-ACP methyl ester carboxylesterase